MSGPEALEALQRDVETALSQRDYLATALANVLVAVGALRPDAAPGPGPELLLAAEDFVRNAATSASDDGAAIPEADDTLEETDEAPPEPDAPEPASSAPPPSAGINSELRLHREAVHQGKAKADKLCLSPFCQSALPASWPSSYCTSKCEADGPA